jgi:hypothetical protein
LHAVLVPFADWFPASAEIIIGGFVIMGSNHWGKIRFHNEFAPFWRLAEYFLAETVVATLSIILLENPLTDYIGANLPYLPAMIFFNIANLMAWFIYAFDYDFMTQNKLIVVLGLYCLTMLSYIIAYGFG